MNTISDVVPRGGLGRFANRLRVGGPVTVAYLGGSITWGGHASDIERTSYRALTTQWLERTYPRSVVRAINAGVGGTGSDLGAFRVGRDVLAHEPDLVFLEFAVNDMGRSDESVLAAFEGIVRAIRRARPGADLCVVYTLHQDHLKEYASGELPRTVMLHEQVAERYGLASIHMARDAARRVAAGEVSWDTFSRDSCHPTDAGFAMYGQTLREGLTAMLAGPQDAGDVTLAPPLSADPWDAATMRAVRPDDVGEGWSYRPMVASGGWNCFTGLLVADQPGATVALPFEGRHGGLLFELGPSSGDIDVAVDDGPVTRLRVFDKWALGMTRPQYRIVADGLMPGRHVMRVTVAGTSDERATGCDVRVGYVMSR